ncbi:hypothetical protein, partial [Rivihabitans pingtungensis]|uniref:hypothetical protein n=1 Tax=Rivihabitans pingtungensis TaxID=1054498 RepID=UPI0023F49BFA
MPRRQLPAPDAGDLQPSWCRLWLWVQKHRQSLANLIGQTRSKDKNIAEKLVQAEASLEPMLEQVLQELSWSQSNDLLMRAYICLIELERRASNKVEQHWDENGKVNLDNETYVLLSPLRHTARVGSDKERFALSDELAIDGTLGLRFRWVKTPYGQDIVRKRITELADFQGKSSVCVAMAPFASHRDMHWAAFPDDANELNSRVPMRCGGSIDKDAMAARLDSILRTAWDASAHVLLLPELVVDDDLLQHCKRWLETHNLRAPRLRLVVAGSRHCHEGENFANRCTVLDAAGDVLWEQDKRSHFVIDQPDALQTLFPGSEMAKVFEPTSLGKTITVAETEIGRLLTPICLDYLKGDLWDELGADMYLVPAMSGNLSRFVDQAKAMGGRHGAASFVCNAQDSATEEKCRLAYLPLKTQPLIQRLPSPSEITPPLFTVEVCPGQVFSNTPIGSQPLKP